MMSIHDGVDPYTSFNAADYEKGTTTTTTSTTTTTTTTTINTTTSSTTSSSSLSLLLGYIVSTGDKKTLNVKFFDDGDLDDDVEIIPYASPGVYYFKKWEYY